MTEKKHILVISQYFYPESFRINDIAAEWVKRGYRVTVLTGIPNYPMGKFYDGYDYRHKRRENWNGVEIVRIPLIPRGHGVLGMVANYFSFLLSGWLWVKTSRLKADLVFTFEVSPMTQALIGVWYAKKHRVPSFLYVQDLWPENVETVTGIHSRLVIGPIDRMVDKIYNGTDHILATSPSFVEAIANRKVPVGRDKLLYWPQYAEEFYRPLPPVRESRIPELSAVLRSDAFKIAFTGNIGTAQGLSVLPGAAALLKGENLRFVIVGDGRYQDELLSEIRRKGVEDMFVMIPRQPAERIPEILSVCDCGFISFNNAALWRMTIPAKLQSYMACGKAIVSSANGETRRVIEEAACGICTELGDEAALAEGIRKLMCADPAAKGRRARAYFEAHFDKRMLMDEMDDLFLRC